MKFTVLAVAALAVASNAAYHEPKYVPKHDSYEKHDKGCQIGPNGVEPADFRLELGICLCPDWHKYDPCYGKHGGCVKTEYKIDAVHEALKHNVKAQYKDIAEIVECPYKKEEHKPHYYESSSEKYYESSTDKYYEKETPKYYYSESTETKYEPRYYEESSKSTKEQPRYYESSETTKDYLGKKDFNVELPKYNHQGY